VVAERRLASAVVPSPVSREAWASHGAIASRQSQETAKAFMPRIDILVRPEIVKVIRVKHTVRGRAATAASEYAHALISRAACLDAASSVSRMFDTARSRAYAVSKFSDRTWG
jgi:hypothetical protein